MGTFIKILRGELTGESRGPVAQPGQRVRLISERSWVRSPAGPYPFWFETKNLKVDP